MAAPRLVELRQQVSSESFEMGVCYASPLALKECKKNSLSPRKVLQRHAAGRWGEVSGKQARRNRRLVESPGWRRAGRVFGWRIEGVYPLEATEVVVSTEPGGSRSSLVTSAELERCRRQARRERKAKAARLWQRSRPVLGAVLRAGIRVALVAALVVAAVLVVREGTQWLARPAYGIYASDVQVMILIVVVFMFFKILLGSRRRRGGRRSYRYSYRYRRGR